jgi:hypothetical protein
MGKLKSKKKDGSSDDVISLIVNDCVRITIVMALGHFANCMYTKNTAILNEQFVNGLLFYLIGTVIFLVFFHKKCLLSSNIIY